MTALLRPGCAVLILLALAIGAAAAGPEHTVYEPEAEIPHGTVVLLHGLNRTAWSMQDMAVALSQAGYRAVNVNYPSAEHPVEFLAGLLDTQLERCCAPDLERGVHFVTHSLGGVLLRVWAVEHSGRTVRRSVMLSPPSQGSKLADELKDSALYKVVTGPAGQQLGTGADSVPRKLPPVGFELGIITGSASLNPVFSWLIPGDDDGKVSVSRARAPGMSDFLVVDENHTFIMRSEEVIRQTLYFLHSGRFDHGTTGEAAGRSGESQ